MAGLVPAISLRRAQCQPSGVTGTSPVTTGTIYARSRSSRLITLPVVVIGMASMKATSRGYSWPDSRVLTKLWISLASASDGVWPVSYTHLRAHETRHDLVCRL